MNQNLHNIKRIYFLIPVVIICSLLFGLVILKLTTCYDCCNKNPFSTCAPNLTDELELEQHSFQIQLISTNTNEKGTIYLDEISGYNPASSTFRIDKSDLSFEIENVGDFFYNFDEMKIIYNEEELLKAVYIPPISSSLTADGYDASFGIKELNEYWEVSILYTNIEWVNKDLEKLLYDSNILPDKYIKNIDKEVYRLDLQSDYYLTAYPDLINNEIDVNACTLKDKDVVVDSDRKEAFRIRQEIKLSEHIRLNSDQEWMVDKMKVSVPQACSIENAETVNINNFDFVKVTSDCYSLPEGNEYLGREYMYGTELGDRYVFFTHVGVSDEEMEQILSTFSLSDEVCENT